MRTPTQTEARHATARSGDARKQPASRGWPTPRSPGEPGPASSPENSRACGPAGPSILGNLVSRALETSISVLLSPQLAVLCYSPRDTSTGSIPVPSPGPPCSPAVVSAMNTSSAVGIRMAGASTDPDGWVSLGAGSEHRNPCSAAAGLHRFILAAGKPVFPSLHQRLPRGDRRQGQLFCSWLGDCGPRGLSEAEGRKERPASHPVPTAHGPSPTCRLRPFSDKAFGGPDALGLSLSLEPGRQGEGIARHGVGSEGRGLECPCLPPNGEDWLAGWRSLGWSVQLWALQQHTLPPAPLSLASQTHGASFVGRSGRALSPPDPRDPGGWIWGGQAPLQGQW